MPGKYTGVSREIAGVLREIAGVSRDIGRHIAWHRPGCWASTPAHRATWPGMLGEYTGVSRDMAGASRDIVAYARPSPASAMTSNPMRTWLEYSEDLFARMWRTLKASNTGANDLFGTQLALSGDTLAVGAYQEDSAAQGVGGNQADNSAGGSGAVYIFH